jgi:hypothetical protein
MDHGQVLFLLTYQVTDKLETGMDNYNGIMTNITIKKKGAEKLLFFYLYFKNLVYHNVAMQ